MLDHGFEEHKIAGLGVPIQAQESRSDCFFEHMFDQENPVPRNPHVRSF